MTYSRLVWTHGQDDLPVEILSEYDAAGWECRKVERFSTGMVSVAGPAESSGPDGQSIQQGWAAGAMPTALRGHGPRQDMPTQSRGHGTQNPPFEIGCRTTALSAIQRMPDAEVVAEPEFRVESLSADEFERAWSQATRAVSPPNGAAAPPAVPTAR